MENHSQKLVCLAMVTQCGKLSNGSQVRVLLGVLMVQKRYQFWTKDGIQWTEWFDWDSDLRDKWQLKNRLLNEYKEGNANL